MSNRYTNLSTSTYKPLSLNDIMLVPTVKQKQHDEAQAMADQYQSLTSNRLSQDAEGVDAKLSELRGKADNITNSLLERGVSRDTLSQLNKLKRDKELEFSQEGLIGNAQANYTGAMSFVNELATKKERQAGWSPAQAKQWAQKQVMGFKGTRNEDGTFNSFSGQELENNVNENEWINKNLKIVASESHPELLKFAGNLNQFTKAYQNNQIDELTYKKIMNSLTTMAQYDPELQGSLKQKGLLTGEQNANLVGEWKIDPKSKKEYFQPMSSFGMQLHGAATGAQYKNVKGTITTVDDPWALHLAKRGLEQQDADNLALAVNGELTTIDPVKYEDLQKSLNLGLQELNRSKTSLNQSLNKIMARGLSKEDAMKDPAYKQALQQHNDSALRYNNTKSSVDNIMNKTASGFDQLDRNRINAARDTKLTLNELDRLNANGLRGALNKKEIDNVLKKYGSSYDKIFGESKFGTIDQNVYETKIYKLFAGRHDLTPTEDNYEYRKALKKTEELRSKTDAYLKNNPYAQDYINFSGNVTGEYKGKIGAIEQGLTNLFTNTGGRGWSNAYTGSGMEAEMAQYTEKGYKYNLMVSNGIAPTGDAIETLNVTDPNGVVVKSYPVTRGRESNKTQYEVGKSLSGHPMYSREGNNMMANYELMPKIQELSIHDESFSSKVIPSLETEDGNFVYIKKYEPGVFTVTEINKADALKGKIVKAKNAKESQSLGGSQDIVNYLNQ